MAERTLVHRGVTITVGEFAVAYLLVDEFEEGGSLLRAGSHSPR